MLHPVLPAIKGRAFVKDLLVIGTRGSKLALKQTEIVKNFLENYWQGLEIKVEIIKTTGDKMTDVPLAKIGGKGLFVKEIEEALLEGKIDLAVHSMKDVPSEIPEGLKIAATPRREDPRDVFVSMKARSLQELPEGSVIGTSSLRRASQIRNRHPELQVQMLRGNVDTRLRKLQEGLYDAIILAAAGIHRMGLQSFITSYMDPLDFLPAIGQGVLAIEIREDDKNTMELIRPFHDEETFKAVMAERAFLRRLGGGCQIPIGGHAFIRDGSLWMVGMVASIDGKVVIKRERKGSPEEAEKLGTELAEIILEEGGMEILEAIY